MPRKPRVTITIRHTGRIHIGMDTEAYGVLAAMFQAENIKLERFAMSFPAGAKAAVTTSAARTRILKAMDTFRRSLSEPQQSKNPTIH